jgi:hypothetical protein
MARLLKLRVLLNLLISDLLLFIFAILLFFAILTATFAALAYHQWLPELSAYLQSESTSTNAAPFLAATSSRPSTP